MKRTQLYLDEDLWGVLHAEARSQRTTISDLARTAIRERYLGKQSQRMKAMQAFVGIRKHAPETPDAEEIVRRLRRGNRLDRLAQK
jgi:hypothetical protein